MGWQQKLLDPGLREGSGVREMIPIPQEHLGGQPVQWGDTLDAASAGVPDLPSLLWAWDTAGFDLKALPSKHEMSLLPGQP